MCVFPSARVSSQADVRLLQLIFAVESETGTAKPIMVDEDPTATESPNSERRGNRNSLLYEASGAGELEQKLEKLRGGLVPVFAI